MVFTPKGKGIILPKGATALDFAYKIHSWIGKYAVNVFRNNKHELTRLNSKVHEMARIDTNLFHV